MIFPIQRFGMGFECQTQATESWKGQSSYKLFNLKSAEISVVTIFSDSYLFGKLIAISLTDWLATARFLFFFLGTRARGRGCCSDR